MKLKLWPNDVRGQFTGKDPDAGKERRQKEKGMAEDEIVGYLYRLNGSEQPQDVVKDIVKETVKGREAWHAAVHGVPESDVTCYNCYIFSLVTEQHKASVKEEDRTILIIYVNPT